MKLAFELLVFAVLLVHAVTRPRATVLKLAKDLQHEGILYFLTLFGA